MAKNFREAERRVKIDGEYNLLSYATSSKSVEMSDGTDLQTKMDSVDSDIESEITRATTEENEIATNLSNEVTRATTAENNLDSKKADIESPALTGTPTAPTATAGTNTTQIATTAFTQTAVSNHNTSTTAHSDIRDLISDLTTRLNALADSDDTTLDQLSEIVAYIKSNRTLIENITTDKVSVSDIIDNLTSTASDKPLSANQGKVLNDLINALSSVVDTKIDTINGDTYIGTSKSGTTGTITHKDVTRTNTTSTASPSSGSTFTAVDSVTSDSKGHITSVNTKTVTIPNAVATQTSAGLESAADKKKLDGIATGAEVNQNAFSNVVVGSTTVAADSKTDTLTLAGSNVTLTPDATNDKVTIGITKDNVISALGYTPGSSVDNNTTYTLSKSGSTITLTGSDGSTTSVTDTDTNTHYTSKNVVGSSTATSNTTSALTNGNVYLNSVENGAVTSTHKISGSGATKVTTDTSGNIVISSTDNNTDTKVTQTVTTSNASYPLLLAPSGQTATATTTSYFDSGVTLNPSTNTIAANVSGTATALTTSAGSATQPVYFSSGKPVACTYTLGKSVPSDAVFTDTHYTSHLYVGALGGTANATSATSNPYLLCVDNTTNRNSIQLKAGSNMSISATSGVVTFASTQRSVSDSLTSTSTTTALSSAGGKSLQDQITTLNSNLLKNCILLGQGTSYGAWNTITLNDSIDNYRMLNVVLSDVNGSTVITQLTFPGHFITHTINCVYILMSNDNMQCLCGGGTSTTMRYYIAGSKSGYTIDLWGIK